MSVNLSGDNNRDSNPELGFRSAELKISRARRHFSDLKLIVSNYMNLSPFRLCVGYDSDKANTIVSMKQIHGVPEEISVVVGDIFHNLRSSLDVIVYGLVSHKAKNKRKIQFPFSDSMEKLDSRIFDCQISESDRILIDLIKEMRPYPSGNKFLFCVNELNNIDKHRVIFPVATLVCLSASELKNIHPAFSFIDGNGVLISSSPEIFRVPLKNLNRNERRWEKSFHGEFKKDHMFKLSFRGLTASSPDFIELIDRCISEIERAVSLIKTAIVDKI